MPAEQARLIASAAYTLARAANADMDISDEETAAIEAELQAQRRIDEPTAVLVTEMAKLQARTVGGTEDYVVTREFRRPRDRRRSGSTSCGRATRSGPPAARSRPRRPRSLNQIAARARPRPGRAQRDPRRLPRAALGGPGGPPARRHRLRHEPRPTARQALGELQVDEAVAEPATDLGQQLRVVGDAAAQLHRQARRPPAPGRG